MPITRESGLAGAQVATVVSGGDRGRADRGGQVDRDVDQAAGRIIGGRGQDLRVEDRIVDREVTVPRDQAEIAGGGMIAVRGEMSGNVTFARHLRHPRKCEWSFCRS